MYCTSRKKGKPIDPNKEVTFFSRLVPGTMGGWTGFPTLLRDGGFDVPIVCWMRNKRIDPSYYITAFVFHLAGVVVVAIERKVPTGYETG